MDFTGKNRTTTTKKKPTKNPVYKCWILCILGVLWWGFLSTSSGFSLEIFAIDWMTQILEVWLLTGYISRQCQTIANILTSDSRLCSAMLQGFRAKNSHNAIERHRRWLCNSVSWKSKQLLQQNHKPLTTDNTWHLFLFLAVSVSSTSIFSLTIFPLCFDEKRKKRRSILNLFAL